MRLGKGKASGKFGVNLQARSGLRSGIQIAGHYDVVCRSPLGEILWDEGIDNLIVDEGLEHSLDGLFASGSQVATWYIGLLKTSPTPLAAWIAADVADAGSGFSDYDEATLPAFTDTRTDQSVTNSGEDDAVFTIDTDSSVIGGAFLISTNAKIPAGVLYSAGAFTLGDQGANIGSTITVTATFTMADAG